MVAKDLVVDQSVVGLLPMCGFGFYELGLDLDIWVGWRARGVEARQEEVHDK